MGNYTSSTGSFPVQPPPTIGEYDAGRNYKSSGSGSSAKTYVSSNLFARGNLTWNSTMAAGNKTVVDAAGWTVSNQRTLSYTVYYGGAMYGMVGLAAALLTLCAMLAGLTLALCALDMTWLRLRSISATPKEKYWHSVLIPLLRPLTIIQEDDLRRCKNKTTSHMDALYVTATSFLRLC
jgi:hypothetical protein